MRAMALIRLPAAVMWPVPALQSFALMQIVMRQAGRMGSGGRSVGPALRILRPCECLLFQHDLCLLEGSFPHLLAVATSLAVLPQLVGSHPMVDYDPQDRVCLEFVPLSCCVWCQCCSTTSSWQQLVLKQRLQLPHWVLSRPSAVRLPACSVVGKHKGVTTANT